MLVNTRLNNFYTLREAAQHCDTSFKEKGLDNLLKPLAFQLERAWIAYEFLNSFVLNMLPQHALAWASSSKCVHFYLLHAVPGADIVSNLKKVWKEKLTCKNPSYSICNLPH